MQHDERAVVSIGIEEDVSAPEVESAGVVFAEIARHGVVHWIHSPTVTTVLSDQVITGVAATQPTQLSPPSSILRIISRSRPVVGQRNLHNRRWHRLAPLLEDDG